MSYTPDEDFADFLTKFGQPFAAKAADEAVLQKYRDILPDQLLTYWRNTVSAVLQAACFG